MDIGEHIKELRLQCGLTQEELGNRCELTKGYISQLENNITSPSITTLKDLVSALGTDLRDFFSRDIDDKIVFTQKDFSVKTSENSKITWIVPNSQKNEMEPILIEVNPHSSTEEDIPHDGEEFGYVLQGEATIHIGKRKHIAQANESFYYTANKMHYIQNNKDEPLKILWVSSPPNF